MAHPANSNASCQKCLDECKASGGFYNARMKFARPVGEMFGGEADLNPVGCNATTLSMAKFHF